MSLENTPFGPCFVAHVHGELEGVVAGNVAHGLECQRRFAIRRAAMGPIP
jgi:hypothetical protein